MAGVYNDRTKVDTAVEEILKLIKPGDVVNQEGRAKWWEIWLKIAYWGIRRHQKKLFGKHANWRDTHTMLYLDKNNTFSVELPKATKKTLREYCLSNLSIYRLTKVAINDYKVDLDMITDGMVGVEYDIGQLLDIALNGILGFGNLRLLKIFDFGRKKKVCSVGVRVAYEKLYLDKIKKPGDREGKWLFYSLNPDKWTEEEIQNYRGTDIEATTPAHFANSNYINFEFDLIARFNNGVFAPLYKKRFRLQK